MSRVTQKAGVDSREGYLRAIFLGGDEICFHLYEARSRELVLGASRRAAIPVERVTQAIDVEIERDA